MVKTAHKTKIKPQADHLLSKASSQIGIAIHEFREHRNPTAHIDAAMKALADARFCVTTGPRHPGTADTGKRSI